MRLNFCSLKTNKNTNVNRTRSFKERCRWNVGGNSKVKAIMLDFNLFYSHNGFVFVELNWVIRLSSGSGFSMCFVVVVICTYAKFSAFLLFVLSYHAFYVTDWLTHLEQLIQQQVNIAISRQYQIDIKSNRILYSTY